MTNYMRSKDRGLSHLEIDVEKYQAMIDHPALSETEKRQFIDALWTVLITFIDLGFDLHPVKVACGKLGPEAIEDCSAPKNMVGSEHILTAQFDDAVSDNGGGDDKESGHES